MIWAVIKYAGGRNLIAGAWRQVIPAAGAALAYGTASALGGSGFIGAFVAGMVFRGLLGRDPGDMNQLTEEVGNVLDGVTFVIFGAILLGPALGELTWQLALYAVLSLTVVRIIPVAIAMLGTHARLPTLGFMGWFGPRGLASIVFAVIIIEESTAPSRAPDRPRDLPHGWDFRSSPMASPPPRWPTATRTGSSATPARRRRRWRAPLLRSPGPAGHCSRARLDRG